jgi:hypothetical protein
MDRRQIFTLVLYVPSLEAGGSETNNTTLRSSDRCFHTSQNLDMTWYIDKEATAEAGSMAVTGMSQLENFSKRPMLTITVCGTPHFEEAVRRGVKSNSHDIYITYSEFHPESTLTSQDAQQRYS